MSTNNFERAQSTKQALPTAYKCATCMLDCNGNMLKCEPCKRFFHIDCTDYDSSKKKRFYCANCKTKYLKKWAESRKKKREQRLLESQQRTPESGQKPTDTNIVGVDGDVDVQDDDDTLLDDVNSENGNAPANQLVISCDNGLVSVEIPPPQHEKPGDSTMLSDVQPRDTQNPSDLQICNQTLSNGAHLCVDTNKKHGGERNSKEDGATQIQAFKFDSISGLGCQKLIGGQNSMHSRNQETGSLQKAASSTVTSNISSRAFREQLVLVQNEKSQREIEFIDGKLKLLAARRKADEEELQLLEMRREVERARENQVVEALYARSIRSSSSSSKSRPTTSDRTQCWVTEQNREKPTRNTAPAIKRPPPTNDGPFVRAIQHVPTIIDDVQFHGIHQHIPDESTIIKSKSNRLPHKDSTVHDNARPRIPKTSQWLSARNHDAFMESLTRQPSMSRRLTSEQIAARSCMPRELPHFSGDAHEWPLFITSFMNTTEMCNLSHQENLVRLRQALRGSALRAVQELLVDPKDVPEVLNTLKELFGRPELILRNLILRARQATPVKMDNLESLIHLSTIVRNLCSHIESAGIQEHLENPMLLEELVDKLPPTMKMEYARYLRNHTKENLATFSEWLKGEASLAGRVSRTCYKDLMKPAVRVVPKRAEHVMVNVAPKKIIHPQFQDKTKCRLCEEEHSLCNCPIFLKKSRTERWDVIFNLKYCGICLGQHSFRQCRNRRECNVDKCSMFHHPLLHRHRNEPVPLPSEKREDMPSSSNDSNAVLTISTPNTTTIFRIIPIQLHHNGKSIHSYAFVDEGSSVSMIESSIADELGLEGRSSELRLQWTGSTTKVEINSRIVNVEISGCGDLNPRYLLSRVRTVSALNLPRQSLNPKSVKENYPHLLDADLIGYCNAQPKILLGLAHWAICVPLKTIEGKLNEPIATLCRLGWALSGRVCEGEQSIFPLFHVFENRDDNLHQQVQEFFSIENFGTGPSKPPVSQVDARAEELLKQGVQFKNGRYQAKLLWRFDSINLPDSLQMARRRLNCLMAKMNKNPDLKSNLNSQIKDYLEKKYIRRLSNDELTKNIKCWYLPVFAVTNPNKPGKVRLVWDAAAQVRGVSLNDVLLKGPDLLTPLYDVLIRFRQYSVAVSGDIKEMFHRILVAPEDQPFQRFLWIDDMGQEISYQMQVMTFGAACSPTIAQYVKNSNAERFSSQFQRASLAIKHNHYVDDYLDSFVCEASALKIAKQVTHIHSQAGFQIRNWSSNSKAVVHGLGEGSATLKNLNVGTELSETKVLGLIWDTVDDTLTFAINPNRFDAQLLNGSRIPTKREVLRVLMSIFDPLGLIANLLVQVKILMQEIWRAETDWDEQINSLHHERWLRWVQTIPEVQKVRIPRCFSLIASYYNESRVVLHVFVDASENAFAAVAYLRVQLGTQIQVGLVGAKTKVAPQKPMSIPRLELQAAVLGVRLASTIQSALTMTVHARQFWSDSSTVLAWLQSEPRSHQQFIALRIGEILESSRIREWRYVPTAENVADEGTKWCGGEVNPNNRWFTGPSFLRGEPNLWPTNRFSTVTASEMEICCVQLVEDNLAVPNISRFSQWTRLLNTQARILRIVLKQFRNQGLRGPNSVKILERAEEELVRMAQIDSFRQDYFHLLEDAPLARHSDLVSLSPFIDDHKIIRMRGRTAKARQFLSWESINPVILPRRHRVTYLLLDFYHRKFHHLHSESVVNEVRQKYWIPHLRMALKEVRSLCQHCKIKMRTINVPEMADLPESRIAAHTRPFTHTGLKYFGPLLVTVGRHVEKRWVVLFTCLSVRAIHLEITHTLSSSSAIMAIRAFIARRGVPMVVWSDNGTNFRGASTELRAELAKINAREVTEYFDRIDWRFIPPGSPHMGGSWERLVRSVKSILTEIMPSRHPNDEVLRCAILEAERVINCRPLTYMPIERGNLEALTPNHFLLGSSDGAKPPADIPCNTLELKNQWKKAQQIADCFWRRWIREYLPTLTRRPKWCSPTPPVEIGDIGVIWDESIRGSWRIARIEDVRRSCDGKVRVVIVRTSTGLYTRPVAKFAKLDVTSAEKGEENVATFPHGGENVGPPNSQDEIGSCSTTPLSRDTIKPYNLRSRKEK